MYETFDQYLGKFETQKSSEFEQESRGLLGGAGLKKARAQKLKGNVLLVSANRPKNQQNFCKDFCPSL